MRGRYVLGAWLKLAIIAGILAGAWWYRGGIGDVIGALRNGGLGALAAASAWHIASMVLCGLAMNALATPGRPVLFVLGRWVHEAVGELAGFVPLTGELAAANAMIRRGIRPTQAAALTVVDLSAEAVSQFAFTALGLALWLARHPGLAVTRWTLIGLAIFFPLLLLLLVVQRSPLLRFVETLPARLLPRVWRAPEEAAGIRAAIAAIHAERSRIARCLGLHLAAWLVSTGEAALALWLLGRPLPIVDVVAMESAIMALRSAAFVVPAGLGVQEGAYVVVGAALGLGPDAALALALIKRGRELVYGVPGLLIWHAMTRRRPDRERLSASA